jgi:transposase
MDILYMRCAGLDIHRDSIVACVRLAEAGGVVRLVETFATTTAGLERLSAWLTGHGVTCVAMEATGVYWKPVWAVLAGDFELVLANAHHVKAVPGRKTDVNDATWLADLLAHGLIRPSFVPAMSEQALRDLTRARKQLTREKASHVQRIDKTLQAANIKLGSVLSNIMGQSGRALLEALAAGERDPERLAGLVRTKIRASHAQVVEAVRGRLVAHQRLLLRLYLAQVDALDAALAAIDHELGERVRGAPCARSGDRPAPDHHAGVEPSVSGGCDLRDWAGHEPLSQCRSPDLLGRAVPEERREGGQAPLHPAPARRSLAQGCPGAERLVCGAGQGQLPTCAVSAAQSAPGPPQGDCGCGGRHADGDLPHAQTRGGVSRSRARSLSAHRAISSCRSPRPKARRTRLRRHPDATGCRMTVSS